MLEPKPRCSRPVRRAVLVRWLPLVLAAGSLCHASLAAALGLGDLTLRSYLNQPLKADIVLTDTAGLEASEVTASIASAEDYAKAGVERVFFLNDLRFSADFSGARKVIHVTSSKAVTEPYLSFLVQVNRPGGQLLRTFTVLLDPPGTVALPAEPAPVAQVPGTGRAQAPAAARPPAAARSAAASKPATPSADAQTQRTLAQLQERLQNLQTEVDAKDQAVADLKNQLQQARLAAPNAPVTSAATPASTASAPATASTAASAATPADPGKTASTAPLNTAVAPAQPAKIVPPAAAVVPAAVAVDDFDWLPVLGVLALVLLLLALLILRRRQRQRAVPVATDSTPSDDAQVIQAAPSQAPAEAVVVAPSVRLLPQQEPVAPVRRDSAPATDALDGASIYIAYGRFNEAIGILREGLAKQPERVDLRFRLLEVLGQQGDLGGFEEEERAALATGVTPERIQQIRAQSPKLETAEAAAKAASVAATALAATAAAVAASAALAPREPEPEPLLDSDLDSDQPVGLAMNTVAEPDFDFDLDASAADDLELLASHQPEAPAADEFQLNLDDLSMDADWEMVSPFEPAAATRKPSAEMPTELAEAPAVDPLFATNLRELPEVDESADEQFLSDFVGLDDLGGFDDLGLDTAAVEQQPLPGDLDSSDNDFLASFMSDADLPDLEGMSLDFDSLDSQQASAEKLEQAQGLIRNGDFHSASEVLQALLRDGDPTCQASARELLASLR
jgi:pilus assembly protein FimV